MEAARWYLGFLSELARSLRLEVDVEAWWNDTSPKLTYTQCLLAFLVEITLTEPNKRIVIFVDEIDVALQLDYTDDFFAAIRVAYTDRDQYPAYEQIGIVLLGVATPDELIRDSGRTPFNIGQRIDLTYFSFDEVRPLAGALGLPNTEGLEVLREVFEWTSGHPFLTQQLLDELASSGPQPPYDVAVNDAVERLYLGVEIEKNRNLLFVHKTLTERIPPEYKRAAAAIYRKVRDSAERVLDDPDSLPTMWLKLAGIVRNQDKELVVSNEIYWRIFDETWIDENLQRPLPRALWLLFVAMFAVISGIVSFALRTWLLPSGEVTVTPTLTPTAWQTPGLTGVPTHTPTPSAPETPFLLVEFLNSIFGEAMFLLLSMSVLFVIAPVFLWLFDMFSRVNVNTATVKKLTSRLGLARTQAKRIIAFRRRYGPFQSLEEIEHVPGVSKRTMLLVAGKGKVKPFVRFSTSYYYRRIWSYMAIRLIEVFRPLRDD